MDESYSTLRLPQSIFFQFDEEAENRTSVPLTATESERLSIPRRPSMRYLMHSNFLQPGHTMAQLDSIYSRFERLARVYPDYFNLIQDWTFDGQFLYLQLRNGSSDEVQSLMDYLHRGFETVTTIRRVIATEISVTAFNSNAMEDRYADYHFVSNIIMEPRVYPNFFDLIQEWTFDGRFLYLQLRNGSSDELQSLLDYMDRRFETVSTYRRVFGTEISVPAFHSNAFEDSYDQSALIIVFRSRFSRGRLPRGHTHQQIDELFSSMMRQ